MGFFGSKDEPVCRLQVITLDHVIEGTAVTSGQNFVSSTVLTDVTIRSSSGTTTGASWAVGENTGGVIGLVPLDDAAREELLARSVTGKHELPATIFTGRYIVRGTLLAFDEDPRVLVQASPLAVRDAMIEALTPGSPVGTLSVPLVVLYMNELQGLVLA